MADTTGCLHENFRADVEVVRLTDEEGGAVTGYSASIRITCADCRHPMVFLGLPMGYSSEGAHVSIDGQEARLGLVPYGVFLPPSASVKGFNVRFTPMGPYSPPC
jgi:hypothetical protein